jgi:undecaprenyl-phosphate 4-deoxy-4-formamido-L-arabinose transferase
MEWLMLPKGLSVVVPVYNSEGSLRALVERLQPVLQATGEPFEVLLVNDGSRDGSWAVVQELAVAFPAVRGFSLRKNYGQHNALLCGIRSARYSRLVTIDDDLQNPPEEIPRLLEQLGTFDVVYGTPEQETHGLLRNVASQVTKLVLQKTMGAATARRISAFRAFHTPIRDAFENYQGPFVSIDVLLTWGTSKFTAVKVRHAPRTIGKSNYTVRKLIVHALNMTTGFSTWPLQLASIVGFVFSVFGFLALVWVLGVYFIKGGSPPGFPFLASIVAIFSGAQLFALGIVGEYLARLHFRMMDRPAYTVGQRAGGEDA